MLIDVGNTPTAIPRKSTHVIAAQALHIAFADCGVDKIVSTCS
jgi:hypothetical protein